MCYGLLCIRIFLLCILLSTPLPVIKCDLANVGDRQTPDVVWSQNRDVIRDSLLPGHITAKRD
jgi:hypothetical protein